MSQLSRRQCMGRCTAWAATTGLMEVATAAPKHDKPHGRGHPHHHRHFEAAGEAPDSLNGIARARGLAFGSCLGTGFKPVALPGQPRDRLPLKPLAAAFDDPDLRALFVAQCGIVVPENELKWYALQPTPKAYDFERADQLIDFAQRYKLAVRGHTLLWNRSRWLPDWLNKFDFGTAPAAAAERVLRSHIATVCRRYNDSVFSWDVVNETIAPATGELEESPFTKALGDNAIDIAFHAAREAAPKAQLVYNDYMGWSPGDAAHRAGVLKLLDRLKKNNVPVDALGIQAHIGSSAAGTGTGPLGDADPVEWKKFLDAVTAMGLDLVITEFDVNDRFIGGTIAERDRAVADYAKAFLDIAFGCPRLRYVMTWGLSDRYSWLQNSSPRPDGLPKRCLPYDDKMQPKPLRETMAGAFAAAPARPALTIKTA